MMTGMISAEKRLIFSMELAMPYSMTRVVLMMPNAPPYTSTMDTMLAASISPSGMACSIPKMLTGVCSICW